MSESSIPGSDPGACPDCGGWRKAGMVHRCICGAVHDRALAVCTLPRGHEGDHRNAQGYWMPQPGESAGHRRPA